MTWVVKAELDREAPRLSLRLSLEAQYWLYFSFSQNQDWKERVEEGAEAEGGQEGEEEWHEEARLAGW